MKHKIFIDKQVITDNRRLGSSKPPIIIEDENGLINRVGGVNILDSYGNVLVAVKYDPDIEFGPVAWIETDLDLTTE